MICDGVAVTDQRTHNIWLCHCEECTQQRTKIISASKERIRQIEEAHKKVADSTLHFGINGTE